MIDPAAPRSAGSSSRRSWMARWMALLRAIGNVQAWILLTLFYVVVIAPIGLIFRLRGADPLRVRRRGQSPERGASRVEGSSWQPLPSQYDDLKQALQQS